MQHSPLESETLRQTRDLISLASECFATPIPQPDVRFDLRGKAAGMALLPRHGQGIIRYNRVLLEENGQAFIRDTVPHEVAHLVAGILYGRGIKPHGAEWRRIMTSFGAAPVRCHNFAVPPHAARRMRYYPYRCACREHQLSAVRHNRSRAGVVYRCTRCNSNLIHIFYPCTEK